MKDQPSVWGFSEVGPKRKLFREKKTDIFFWEAKAERAHACLGLLVEDYPTCKSKA